MAQKNNEYETLLSYLNTNNDFQKESLKNKSIKSYEDIQKSNNKLKESFDSTKIIEECVDNNKSITPHFSTNNSSVGFDVDKFENMMRSRLIDEHKKLQSYERPYISVTELFYCIRKSYYSRLKYAIDLKKQFNFAYLDLINRIGNTVHDYVQEIYNFTEVEKTVVSEKYKVKGRVDAIYEKFLYEFKTLDEKKFTGIYIKEHYYQPIIYSYILNTEYNYNIKTITLVYFFRDNIKRRPYTIDLPLDNKIAESFLNQAIMLQNSLLSKEIPEPFNSSSDQCKWCSYIEYCKKDKSKMKKPFENSVSNMKSKEIEVDLFDSDEKIKNREIKFLL